MSSTQSQSRDKKETKRKLAVAAGDADRPAKLRKGGDGAPAASSPAARHPALADAWPSFQSSLASLRSELATIDLVIYKNHSQHRRTRYWQALRRAHKEAQRLAAGMKRLGEADFQAAATLDDSPAAVGGRAKLRAGATICDAQAAKLLAASRALTAQQTGGGFAALMAVLTGSVAQYLYLALRLRDAMGALAPPAAGAVAVEDGAAAGRDEGSAKANDASARSTTNVSDTSRKGGAAKAPGPVAALKTR